MPKTARLFIPLIILAAALSYLNSIHNEFIWDDEDFIVKNSTIKDWRSWPRVFTENMVHGARKGSNFYRPLQSISHGIDYLLWKEKPYGHHALNIIFHTLTAVLVYLMLKEIFIKEIGFLAGLFFAIHPVHTEVITYISGRGEPMAGFFILLAILLYRKNILLSCLSFIAGILSKESALIAPFLIMLYAYFHARPFEPGSKNNTNSVRAIETSRGLLLKKILPFIFIAVIYCALRLTILNFSHTIGNNLPRPYYYVPLYLRFLTFLKTVPLYFGVLLWPFGLHMERKIDLASSIFDPGVFAGLMIVSIIFLAALSLRKHKPVFIFSSAWFFIAIFPVSNIIPINALMYEHWLYLPSIGFFTAIAAIFSSFFTRKNTARYAAISLAILLSFFYIWRTMERNKDWQNPISFYESAIKYMPDSGRLHNNLAMAYSDKGRIEDAAREYEKAISLGDYYPQTHYNLSNIYLQKNDYENAIKELKRSIEIDNSFLYAHESLALIYFNQKNFSDARKEAGRILNLEPDNKIAGRIIRMLSE